MPCWQLEVPSLMPPRSYQVLHLHHRWEWLGDRHCHAKGHSVEHANGKCCCCRLALLYSIAASPSCLACCLAWTIPQVGFNLVRKVSVTKPCQAHRACQAPGWLKTFGQFWCLGGVVHDWCKPGVWPFFVHRLAGVGKPLFRCQISFFW